MRKVALIVGGISSIGGAIGLLLAKHSATATKNAVSGVAPPMPAGSANAVDVFLTGYWPYQAGLSAKQRLMEGKPVDRKGQPLTTVEQHLANPEAHPFVSLAGDYTIWPYGQKVIIPWGDKTVVGRVVDTGGHFHGVNKVFRVVGREPIDVCVDSSSTVIPSKRVSASVIVGDHFDKASAPLALERAGRPAVGYCGFDCLGAEVV